jgi:hypothetical protein
MGQSSPNLVTLIEQPTLLAFFVMQVPSSISTPLIMSFARLAVTQLNEGH